MNKMIGCEFFLNRYKPLEDKELRLDYLNLNIKDSVFISDSNKAISFVLEQNRFSISEKRVLIPSFTSAAIVDQFRDAGYRVFYHMINRDLTFNRELFLEDIESIRPSIVVVHGYFGFDSLGNIKDIIQHIKTTGVLVIEDMTQTLYSNIEHTYADYYIFDFKVWAALPDGGCIVSNKKSFSYKPFAVDIGFQEKRIEAMHTKYLYINGDIDVRDQFSNLFNEANNLLLNQKTIYAMSPVSMKIQANIDIDFLRNARIANYNILHRALRNSRVVEPVFGEVEEDVVPLYFPLYTKCNRNDLVDYLEANSIYTSTVWSKPSNCKESIDEVAEWLYENILTIPCDQRYIDLDMERVIDVIRSYEDLIENKNHKEIVNKGL